jgi:hypothetical protein
MKNGLAKLYKKFGEMAQFLLTTADRANGPDNSAVPAGVGHIVD